MNKHSVITSELNNNLNLHNKSVAKLNSNRGINLNQKIGVIKFFLESLSKFNANLVYNQFTLYNFNKSTKLTNYSFDRVINLLTLSFLSMGCFISKPHIQVLYKPNYKEEAKGKKPKISNIVQFWSNLDSNIPFTLNHYNKKIYIQLFYYVRSDYPILKYLQQLNLKYHHIQRLIKHYLILEQDNNEHANQLKQTMLTSLTDIKTQIREEQKSIIKKNILRKYTKHFHHLGDRLSTILNAEVELELVRLYKPYYNSYILAQNLSVESYRHRFVKLVSRLFNQITFKNNVPFDANFLSNSSGIDKESHRIINTLQELSHLSTRQGGSSIHLDYKNNYSFASSLTGMSIKLGGRTFKERIIPRMTQKRIQKGTLNRSKVVFMDRALFTSKTKKGAYSFSVKIGHIF